MLDRWKQKLTNLAVEHGHAVRSLADERRSLKASKARRGVALEAQALVQTVAEAVQRKAHEQVASVVSRCLEAVFGTSAYEFKIDFQKARGKTEAR